MMFVRISTVFCIVAPVLCVSSEHVGATPEDETWLIQFQTTMDHRSSDTDKIMSEDLAAELLPILSKLPNMSKIAALDPVQAICNKIEGWFSPLTNWLNITLNESSQNIDMVLNESLVMQESLLKVLRNKTVQMKKQLRTAEFVFQIGLLPGGPIEKKLLKALAPMNLGDALHLDRYKVAQPAGGNATFYDLLMKGLVQQLRVGFKETDRKARENATMAIQHLNASMEAGMAEMGLLGQQVGASLANFTGTLSKDMESVMPVDCSSVYEQPIGNANKTIEGIERNIQIKLSNLASGVREATELFKAIVDPDA